ncbi:MAG: rhamnose kinase [Pseudonocardiales bacterium]|nr:rhamnose kinase [Pseudonocardiales bacterium]
MGLVGSGGTGGAVPSGGPVFDVDAADLLAPDDMPARVAAACNQQGQRAPTTPAQITRCILGSLALAFAEAVRDASRLSGRSVEVVHLVGGGSQNTLLCQLTADALGLPVVAGPVEATAIGNIIVQARTHDLIQGDLWSLRRLVRATHAVTTYQPRSDPR